MKPCSSIRKRSGSVRPRNAKSASSPSSSARTTRRYSPNSATPTGPVAHQTERRVAGADAEERPSRSDPVDRRDAVGRHRCDSRARDRDPGAELDPARPLRRQRQHRVTVRPDHLAVRDPGVAVPERLCPFDVTDVVDLAGDADAEVHAVSRAVGEGRSVAPRAAAADTAARKGAVTFRFWYDSGCRNAETDGFTSGLVRGLDRFVA